MTEDRIKSLIDGKITSEYSMLSNVEIISELQTRVNKYVEILEKFDAEKERTKYKYMSMWIDSAKKRIVDLREIDRIQSNFKLNRTKLLQLMDLRK